MNTQVRTRLVTIAVTACSVALLFATGAQAANYTLGSPLPAAAGKLVSGVAVDQSSHDVYVASCGVEEGLACNGGTGAFKEFSSAGSELACSLEGAPAHPSSVAVAPVTGNVDVYALVGTEEILGKAEVFVYGANCGAKQHEFPVNASGNSPVPEPTVDPVGTFLFPAGQFLESCSQSGACSNAVSGGFEYSTGVAVDASGDLYLASNPSVECAESGAVGKLVKYLPDGKGGYSEVGAFAGLDGSSGHAEVTSVTVDKRTGQVFVGHGCGGSFKVERYRAGGAKIDEFGAGTFSFGSFLVYNELAVDESTGRVYATDSGHEKVQEFNYSGPAFVSLGTSVVGEGSVVCEVGGHEEPCAPEYETGTIVTVKALPEAGARFVQWTDATGSAVAPCEGQTANRCTFTVSAASTIQAKFGVPFAHPSFLRVFKGANGSGSVKSVAVGLNCNTACEEGQGSFEEGVTVELEETPQVGSVFAGWIGCRHASATTCQVTLGSPQVEVTAVFLTEGKEGPAGKEGAAGKEGPAGKEGAAGKTGTAGKEGKQGTTGATGPTGAQGQQGPAGTPGTAGPAGPVGPSGAQGPQGLPGPAGKVTCTIKQAGKKAKVTCTVKYPTQAKSSSTRRSVRWTLVQHGHIVAHGASRKTPKLKLGALRHGTYTLYLQGQHQGTVIHVH